MSRRQTPSQSALIQQRRIAAAIHDKGLYAKLESADDARKELIAMDYACRAFLISLKVGNQGNPEIGARVLREMQRGDVQEPSEFAEVMMTEDAIINGPKVKSSILAVTWNTAGGETVKTRQQWKDSPEGKDWATWIQRKIHFDPPEIVILALQEWNTMNKFHEAFGDWLDAADSKNGYIRHKAITLKTAFRFIKRDFSQILSIYVRKTPGQDIKSEKVKEICFGASRSCVKGSLVAKISPVLGNPLFVVASHFPFGGEDNWKERDDAYRKTVRAAPQLRGDDPVLWMGDLNYREFKKGTEEDQLTRGIKSRPVFEGYKEGIDDRGPFPPGGFSPTCKFNPFLGDDADGRARMISARFQGLPIAYNVKRKPSYCDRVLWRPGDDTTFKVTAYDAASIGGALESDHNAVSASFQYFNRTTIMI